MNTNHTAQTIVDGITRQGFLLDLHVSRWSGEVQLSEKDLALEDVSNEEMLRLGRKRLIAKDALSPIVATEMRMRSLVERYSIKFPLGDAHFVPVKAFGKLLSLLEEERQTWDSQVETLIANYEHHKAEALKSWKKTTKDLQAKFGLDDQWRKDFEARLKSAYPNADQVKAKFRVSWVPYQIALPDGLTVEAIGAHEAQEMARLASEARAKVENELSSFVGEASVILRSRAADLCRRIAAKIKAGDKISERSFNPLRDLVDEFADMDFTGDTEFQVILDDLKKTWLGPNSKAGPANRAREDGDFAKSLGEALEVVAEKAVGEAEKVASEAVERFLAFGKAGRKLAV